MYKKVEPFDGPRPGVPLRDEAYRSIRQMIIEGAVAPRTLVRESHLARDLGMSRTPVREALRRLEAEGYLREIPYGGFVVVEVEAEDLVNVYEVRAVLEGLAARFAAHRSGRTEVAELEELMEAMEAARGDDRRLAYLNSRFHDVISRASRNGYLESMLSNIRDVFERYRPAALAHPGRRDSAHGEHKRLLAVIQTGEADRAEELARDHVLRAMEVRLGTSEATPDRAETPRLPRSEAP